MKIHFGRTREDIALRISFCGNIAAGPVASDWAAVDCSKCIRKKEQLEKSKRAVCPTCGHRAKAGTPRPYRLKVDA